jgi:A/G-specific adenine glycosylase
MRIAPRLIAWQRVHGRHGLPWQQTRDPYRVWLSEIMLQQTQVAAVIDYYARFLKAFPNVKKLAQAKTPKVMAQWAGLGYYARARNLHACAQRVVSDWGGSFPTTARELVTLPGIGPSTAAAIAAFCFGERAAILDGNVKRVFARHGGIEGDPSTRAVEQRLWDMAREQLPSARVSNNDANAMATYTQGLMDLGATLCTRNRPRCQDCPIHSDCTARKEGRTDELPSARARKTLPERSVAIMLAHRPGHILLEQRPATGIWGGLWSLPEFSVDVSSTDFCASLGLHVTKIEKLPAFLHVFTHYRLTITPVIARTSEPKSSAAEQSLSKPTFHWTKIGALHSKGLPAPIRKLLLGLISDNVLR